VTILLCFVLGAFGVVYVISGIKLFLWGLWNLLRGDD